MQGLPIIENQEKNSSSDTVFSTKHALTVKNNESIL